MRQRGRERAPNRFDVLRLSVNRPGAEQVALVVGQGTNQRDALRARDQRQEWSCIGALCVLQEYHRGMGNVERKGAEVVA